jgi:hypothetical protein
VQASIPKYTQDISWTYASREEAEWQTPRDMIVYFSRPGCRMERWSGLLFGAATSAAFRALFCFMDYSPT